MPAMGGKRTLDAEQAVDAPYFCDFTPRRSPTNCPPVKTWKPLPLEYSHREIARCRRRQYSEPLCRNVGFDGHFRGPDRKTSLYALVEEPLRLLKVAR